MGFFSYIPFMECNRDVLSMRNRLNGSININGNEMIFDKGIGYIEKDWGISFPKSYIWCQANNFVNSDSSFMLSKADISFKLFHFKGVICSLIVNNEEFRFATYNNTKLIKYEVSDNFVNIILKKSNYYLYVEAKYVEGFDLVAPVDGKMEKGITESIGAIITVILKKDDKIIFSDTSKSCGLEIVI